MRGLPIIRRGIAEGLSGNQIGNLLRLPISMGGMGLGVRRRNLQQAIRAIKAQTDYGTVLNDMPQYLIPDPNTMPVSITKQLRQYSYQWEVKVTPLSAADDGLRNVTVSSSINLSPEDQRFYAEQMVKTNSDLDSISSKAVGGSRAGNQGTFISWEAGTDIT